MEENDLTYVEMVHKARHSGNLAQDSWESSILAAFSWSGKMNTLGASLVDWTDGFKGGPEYLARFLLASELCRLKISSPKESVDDANDAMSYYHSRNCPKCDGRGVIDQNQVACPFCNGTGRRDMPLDRAYRAYKTLTGALEWMDSQMKYRMRYAPHPPKEAVYRLNLPVDNPEFFSDTMNFAGQVTPCRSVETWRY
jgi:hypothetical protein